MTGAVTPAPTAAHSTALPTATHSPHSTAPPPHRAQHPHKSPPTAQRRRRSARGTRTNRHPQHSTAPPPQRAQHPHRSPPTAQHRRHSALSTHQAGLVHGRPELAIQCGQRLCGRHIQDRHARPGLLRLAIRILGHRFCAAGGGIRGAGACVCVCVSLCEQASSLSQPGQCTGPLTACPGQLLVPAQATHGGGGRVCGAAVGATGGRAHRAFQPCGAAVGAKGERTHRAFPGAQGPAPIPTPGPRMSKCILGARPCAAPFSLWSPSLQYTHVHPTKGRGKAGALARPFLPPFPPRTSPT